MTAIAAMSPGGHPVLVGDLLISSALPSDKKTGVPTVGDVPEPTGDHHIVGVRQKVVVISDHLAIAWAGSYIAARVVIRELADVVTKDEATLDDIESYFRKLDPWVAKQDLCVVGHIVSPCTFGSFGYNCRTKCSGLFGEMRVGGSGSKDILQLAEQVTEPIDMEGLNPLEYSVVAALMLTGTLTNEELLTQSTLSSFYGGGYEACALRQGRFEKLDHVTYAWWTLLATGEDQYRFPKKPRQVLKYTYRDQDLVAIVIDFSAESSDGSEQPPQQRVHVASPPHKGASSDAFPRTVEPSDFNSKFLCNIISYRNLAGEVHFLNQLYFSPSAEHPVRFQGDEKQFVVGYRRDFLEDIVRSAKARDRSGSHVAQFIKN